MKAQDIRCAKNLYLYIGVNKDIAGRIIAFTGGSTVTNTWIGASLAVGDSTTVYGNATANPVVSYAVSGDGKLEMAQKNK